MCKPNLGPVDRVLRFALAFWWLTWPPIDQACGLGTSNCPLPWTGWLVAIVAWIALLESMFGWCGLVALMQRK